MPPIIIQCYATPRSLSTVLMYSFHNRKDVTRAYDEPTYAAFVNNNTNVSRPYKDQLLASQSTDISEVLDEVRRAAEKEAGNKGMVYAKHIGKLVAYDSNVMHQWCTLSRARSFILLRRPAKILRSWTRVLETSLLESGFPALEAIYDDMLKDTQRVPIVVDAEDLQRRPRGILTALCRALSIPFDEAMLKWEAGAREEIDGIWAPWWYDSVHKSTCFKPPPKGNDDTDEWMKQMREDPEMRKVIDECERIYRKLAESALLPEGPEKEEEGMVHHRASCHCESVLCEFYTPSKNVVAWDCNCSICTLKRNTHIVVPSSRFNLIKGKGVLKCYQFGTKIAKHYFCPTCGISPFYIPRSNPDGYAITVHCVASGTLGEVEIKKFDGKNWEKFIEGSGIRDQSKEGD